MYSILLYFHPLKNFFIYSLLFFFFFCLIISNIKCLCLQSFDCLCNIHVIFFSQNYIVCILKVGQSRSALQFTIVVMYTKLNTWLFRKNNYKCVLTLCALNVHKQWRRCVFISPVSQNNVKWILIKSYGKIIVNVIIYVKTSLYIIELHNT